MRRCVALVIAGLVTMVVTAAPAAAHTRLTGSTPEQGAALTSAPERVELVFSEQVKDATVTVTGPDGKQWPTGAVTIDGKKVSAPLTPAEGPAGQYTITYRVGSADGHPVAGELAFVMTAPVTPPASVAVVTSDPTSAQAPAPGATTPTVAVQAGQEAEADDGTPDWGWLVGGIAIVAVLVAALVGVVVVFARRRKPRA